MNARLKPKLICLFTTIALAALPTADAFAGRSWTGIVYHHHSHHASAHYTLGNNWITPHNRSHRHRTPLYHFDYGRN